LKRHVYPEAPDKQDDAQDSRRPKRPSDGRAKSSIGPRQSRNEPAPVAAGVFFTALEIAARILEETQYLTENTSFIT
jgi:hypothetical protein